MKTLNQFRSQINEVLKASDPIEKWIDDFVHSKNPKFAGKSTKERIEMAKGAYYGAQKNESASISQNTESMTKMEEDHLVHVSDGSGYDDTPHPKDIEHIKTGAMHTGGQWHGHSDKGAFFKFKSKEDAEQFKRHVDKCPHRSCYADHVTEAVEYKGIGTDVVDKKKKLNPQPNLMSDKKQVKDFKEEVEEIEEGDNGLAAKAKKSGVSLSTLKTVYKRGVAAWNSGHRPGTTPAQWGMARVNSYITKGSGTYGGADKDLHEDARLHKAEYQKGMSASMAKARVAHWKKADKMSDSNPKAYEPAPGDKTAKTTPSVHTKKYHAMYGEAKVYDPITKKMVASKPIKVQAGGGATRNGIPVETGPSKYKQGLKEEQLDEISQKTLKSYVNKAEKEEDKYQQNYTKLRNTRDVTHGKFSDDTPHMADLDRKAVNRANGVYAAKQKLAKEDVEQIDELSKTTLQSYRKKVAKDVGRAYAIHQDPYKKTDKDDMRKLSNRVKGDERAEISLKKEEVQIDEVSKSTLMRYIPAASRAAAQHVYTGKEAQTWAGHHMRAGDYAASDRQLATSKSELGKSIKRLKGIDTATKKLGTKKTFEEFIQGLEESTGLPHKLVQAGKEKWHIYDTKTGELHSTYNNKNVAMKKYGELNDKHAGYDSPGGLVKSKYGVRKEEVELDEATVATRSYDWGKMKVVHQGKSFNIPLHPEHHEAIAKLKSGESTHVKTEDGKTWKASREGDDVHFSNLRGQKASVKHSQMTESRGHKVLATFFKNREVAQRAFTGQNKEAEPKEKEKEEDKKKVNEAKVGVSAKSPHVADPKTTKKTAKEYMHASIPGTKRVNRSQPDNNEVGGGHSTIKEDQYAADYKIKYYVDPITGENKTRKIRPHKVNFANSKMRGEPAQQDAQGDYGMKEEYVVEGGFDNYHEIAKELIKRHGKNIDTSHIRDIEDERDTHRGLDHSEVMHHVNKILKSKEVKEGDEYDEKWKEYKGKSFKKEQRMLNFNDYLKEAALSAKQKKIAAIAGDKDKIDADDLAALRAGKKPVEEAKKCMDEDDMDESGLRMAAHAAHKEGKKEFEFQGKTYPVKVQKEGVLKPELEKGFPARGVKTGASAPKGTTYMPKKDVKEEVEQIDELSKKTLGSYVNKAAKDSRIMGQIATDFENTADKARKQSKKDSFERLNRKYLEKAWKREAGIGKAVGKLAKEEVELDEGRMKDLAYDLDNMSHDEFHKQYGKPKSHFDPTNFKKPVQPGKEMDRARALAQRGMKSVSEQLEEATTRKDFQMVADLIKGHESAEKRKELATHHAGIFAKQNPRFDHAKFMKAAGVNEEVEQEQSSYLKATLSFMDESKYDDYKDALRAKKATQSAYDKDFKPDTTHPHIQVVKGTQYGGENQKDDEGDEKPEAEKEKRGRGRPSGSKSGARLKGGGHEDGGIPVHNLHLPKSYK